MQSTTPFRISHIVFGSFDFDAKKVVVSVVCSIKFGSFYAYGIEYTEIHIYTLDATNEIVGQQHLMCTSS